MRDEWYIRNASSQLDLRIIYMTLRCVFKGQRLGKTAIAEAFAMRRTQHLAVPRFQTSVTREKLGADPALEATPARLLPDFAGTGDLSRSEERTALLAKPSTKNLSQGSNRQFTAAADSLCTYSGSQLELV